MTENWVRNTLIIRLFHYKCCSVFILHNSAEIFAFHMLKSLHTLTNTGLKMDPVWVSKAPIQQWVDFTKYKWSVLTQCQCYDVHFTQYPWVCNPVFLRCDSIIQITKVIGVIQKHVLEQDLPAHPLMQIVFKWPSVQKGY